jgi:uridine phosphorylase
MVVDTLPPAALFHLGYNLPRDLQFITCSFRSVKYVILCGSMSRASTIASTYASLSHPERSKRAQQEDFCKTDRYSLYQPAPEVLVASHGIGLGSADIVLHELTSMLRAAKPGCAADAFCFIRCGSSGGISVPAGSLVVSTGVLNGAAEPLLRTTVLGLPVARAASLCPVLTGRLLAHAEAIAGDWPVVAGKTLCCDTFYAGQARLDGAYGDEEYGDRERRDFLKLCRDSHGVANFEMESLALGAFCQRAGGIPCAVVCAVLVDRLGEGGVDAPTAERSQLLRWEERPVRVVCSFVYESLHGCSSSIEDIDDLESK